MRKLTLAAVVAAMLACAGAAVAQVQGNPTATLVVRVLDDATGKPITGAHVTVGGTILGGLTDKHGSVRVAGIAPGNRFVAATGLGYAADSVQVGFEAGTPVDAELRLAPQPVTLGGITAMGEAAERVLRQRGFYERLRLGGATFIAGERLQKLQTRTNRLTAAFDNVPGVRVTPNMRGSGYVLVSTRSSSGDNFQGQRCFPVIYLDDVKVKYDYGNGRPMENADLNSLVPLNDVVGIEVYQGISNVPYKYDRNPCGVVLIWTRSGQ